ncbi:hypothetical protein CD30_12930 [Ureibacillus massiliensis 4400831 = CIP 108448 = CCUG 49529]|uniref:AMP-dependent synthetase n=1 Tax=Ureibacillus massiliensis 4400831 = CIP 108448 = CCUG 49529 TaxID=1211035 RepID=A0A0A3J4Q4_9BACL|nr:AMP-binding protein [Ureibacillus massiliensis]KGR90153.1 hypothetical protein CD30_12930 [Ureibacillus massiliensis 4400831 = CIP 108448 = CCUG 49529]
MISLNDRRKSFLSKSKNWLPEPIHKFFFKMADQYKDNDFIIDENKTLTYKDVMVQSKQLGAALFSIGLQKGEHVALISPNYGEFIVSKLGVAVAGGVLVPLNYRLKKEEFSYLINQSDSSYVITLDVWNSTDFISMLKELCPEVFQGESSIEFPKLKKIIVFSPQGKKYPGTIDFNDLISSIESEQAGNMLKDLPEQNVNDITDIMYTSGTTSFPKGALITHNMIWRSAFGSCINRGYQESRRIFVPIPFYHCFGYIEGIIAVSMVGGTLITQINFNESEALDLMEAKEADDILCVPTIAIKILHEQRAKPRRNLKFSAMYCAGAEVSIALWKDLKAVFNINELITGYGMTECAAGVLQTSPEDDISFLSKYVGHVIPGGHLGIKELCGNNIQFKVKDLETGEDCPIGKAGELVCRGPLVTNGYYKKPEDTAKAFDEDGWLKTGDIAVIDDNSYISLAGRIKEIYRIGAENVAPKEIEDILTMHEKISQAYVIGVPDEIMGEVGMAWIVPEVNETLTDKEVFDHAMKNLARYKVPKYIKLVEHSDLPMTANGKIQKYKLKEIYFEEKEKLQTLF